MLMEVLKDFLLRLASEKTPTFRRHSRAKAYAGRHVPTAGQEGVVFAGAHWGGIIGEV